MVTPYYIQRGRRLFIERYRYLDPNNEAEIMLSGGVDSATVLFAALENGHKPRCHTFFLADRISDDLKVARSMTKRLGVELNEVPISVDLDSLVQDVARVMREIEWRFHKGPRPTLIQTCHPFLYVLPQVKSEILITGLGADELAVTNRQSAMAMRVDPRCLDRVMRNPLHRGAGDNYREYERMAGKRGIALRNFFEGGSIIKWAWCVSHVDFNAPRQKWAIVAPFKDWWSKGKWYRRNSPFQIGSGLRDLHDKLLTTEWNEGGRAVSFVYNRMARSICTPDLGKHYETGWDIMGQPCDAVFQWPTLGSDD